MKVLMTIFILTSFLSLLSCNQDNKPGSDELQRHEEVPSPQTPNDLELDKDVIDSDEMDIKK